MLTPKSQTGIVNGIVRSSDLFISTVLFSSFTVCNSRPNIEAGCLVGPWYYFNENNYYIEYAINENMFRVFNHEYGTDSPPCYYFIEGGKFYVKRRGEGNVVKYVIVKCDYEQLILQIPHNGKKIFLTRYSPVNVIFNEGDIGSLYDYDPFNESSKRSIPQMILKGLLDAKSPLV